MKRVVFIVEGDTEIIFINRKIIPYLYQKGIQNPMNAQKILTNRKKNKKGGNVGFEYLKNEIIRVNAAGNVLITTFLDFFRIPIDYPSYTNDSSKIRIMEDELRKEMGKYIDGNYFLPHIQRHEIEALMFTNMDGFRIVVDNEKSLEALENIVIHHNNPEDINGGAETAPSKRLMNIFPYQKTVDGEMILEMLHVDDMRAKCPLFNIWLVELEEGLKNDHF